MVEILNMQQSEYDEIQVRMDALHQEILDGTQEIMIKISELCEIEGGFYIAQISSKIEMLLGCIKGQILEEFELYYETERIAVETLIASIRNIDCI